MAKRTDIDVAETMEDKRGRIMQDAEPALRKEIEWIQSWFDRVARESIKSRWELGQRFKAIYDDATTQRGKRYGIHAVEQIQGYFGWDDGVIYNALKLAQKFTPAEIDQICELRMPDGQPLSYSHLISLLTVEDREKRRQLIDKAVAEGWTSKRLALEVAPELAPTKPIADRRGRPLAIPRDFDAVLAQMESFADDFLGRAEQVWETDKHGLNAKMTDFSGAEFTKERAAKIKMVADKLVQLSERSKRLHKGAMDIHQVFAKKLEAQKGALKMIGTPGATKKPTE